MRHGMGKLLFCLLPHETNMAVTGMAGSCLCSSSHAMHTGQHCGGDDRAGSWHLGHCMTEKEGTGTDRQGHAACHA